MVNPDQEFIYKWTEKIRHLGLSTPAAFFLEAYKPLSFIAGQFLIIGQPLLNLFFAPQLTDKTIQLLSQRTDLEAFIRLLEQD